MIRPFDILPETLCDDFALPVFPDNQDCTTYAQKRSQVCGLIILPDGATPPDDWTMISGWAGVIDNSDTTGASARYITGVGAFLPKEVITVNLAGGRHISNADRGYTLTLSISNMDAGHMEFGRKLQRNLKNFSVWIQTVGDRLIGGDYGIKPFYVNAEFPFGQGGNDREQITVAMDFFLPNSRKQQS